MKHDTLFFMPAASVSQEDRQYYTKRYPDIRFATLNPVHPMHEIREGLRENISIAVGRGNTIVQIKKTYPHLHTVEIPITAYDVIRSIDAAECRGRTIAVITNNAGVIGLDMFAPLLGINLITYLFTPMEKLPETIRKAVASGADIVMGGAITCKVAGELHVPSRIFQLGPESMQQAIGEIARLRASINLEVARQGFIARLMDNIAEGVVAVDLEGRVTSVNSVAERMLGKDKAELLGEDIGGVMPGLSRSPVQAELEQALTLNGVALMCNRSPIMHQKKCYGAVFTLHERKKVEHMENVLRIKAYARPHTARYHFADVVGQSREIRQAIQDAKNFARTQFNILISGESGTGKELFAQSIHNESARRNKPFVAVNCAALPSELLQSELFGYVEGAFTSALRSGKAGLFEVAHKGTIFLDEISEMSLAQQAALLRVIQERYIMRLGSSTPIPVDVRIIAATNKNLEQQIAKGEFRQDLYYRLNVLNVDLPPLRARKEDIPLFFRHFIDQRLAAGEPPFSVDGAGIAFLKSYGWPGNIRELHNACERIIATATARQISKAMIRRAVAPQSSGPRPEPVKAPVKEGLRVARDSKEKQHISAITKALEGNAGSMGAAAASLGVDRSTLWRRMKRYNLL